MKVYVASHLKEMNRRKVFQLIREKEMTSKAEITKITGISSPTVIKIVNFLKEQQLVIEAGEAETAIGRRPHMLQLNRECMYAASFVLEGDYLSMGMLNIANEVVYRKNIRVSGSYQQLMQKIQEEYVEQLLKESKISRDKMFGIGIALPVIYDKENQIISGAPLIQEEETVYIEEDIQKLREKYGVLVMIENDTNAQTIGEFQKRGYGGQDDLVFISSGTGLGAGLILNGKLRRGSNFMCGEIGYMTLEENYKSDKKRFGWMEEKVSSRTIADEFGINLLGQQRQMDENCRYEMIEYLAKPLAMAVHNINTCLDCNHIVLGGKNTEVLGTELIEKINKYLEKVSINHITVKMQSSEDVGLIGMSWLLVNKQINNIIESDIEN